MTAAPDRSHAKRARFDPSARWSRRTSGAWLPSLVLYYWCRALIAEPARVEPNGPTSVLRITRCDRPKKYLIWKPIVMSRVDHQSGLPRAAINYCTLVVV